MKKLKKGFLAAASLFLAVTVCWTPAPTPVSTANAVVHPVLRMEIQQTPDAVRPVIVGFQPGFGDSVVGTARQLGVEIGSYWHFINAFAAHANADQVLALAQIPGVKLITPEQTIESSSTSIVDSTHLANAYNYSVQAEETWAQGYDGAGVTVAVVDSGITPGSELNVTHSATFNQSATNSDDQYGHGTHVAGIIAGNGTSSGGKYVGIAPGVDLINVKYSANDGSAREQDLVSALQWIYDNRTTYNIRVVNISATVTKQQSYRESAVAAAVEQLWFSGVVVVVSSGNKGSQSCSTCYAPANDPFVVSVGAVDDNGTKDISDDSSKHWSSGGQTLDGHSKPEVMAPGAEITSYMPSGVLRNLGFVVDTNYFRMGGTSMSAPIVTGIVALMLQKHPEWTPDQVKWVLMNTTRSYLNQPAGGAGIVQANQAVFYSGTPGLANQNLVRSPFLDATAGTISYDNMSWSNMSWSNMSWSNNAFY